MVTSGAVPDPWQNDPRHVAEKSEEFAALIAATREVQDLVAGTNPPEAVVVDAARRFQELAALLQPWAVGEDDAPAGKRHDLPGRGNPLLLPLVIDEQSDGVLRGRVRFTRYYLGANGAAHGGSVPLLFDDVLGRLSNSSGGPRARTAYLHVNFRRITPIGPELQVEATFDREEGRKRYLSGRLTKDGVLLADAEGLFVVLEPGQQ